MTVLHLMLIFVSETCQEPFCGLSQLSGGSSLLSRWLSEKWVILLKLPLHLLFSACFHDFVFLALTSALHPITHFDHILVEHERRFLSKKVCHYFDDYYLLYKSASVKRNKIKINNQSDWWPKTLKKLSQPFIFLLNFITKRVWIKKIRQLKISKFIFPYES